MNDARDRQRIAMANDDVGLRWQVDFPIADMTPTTDSFRSQTKSISPRESAQTIADRGGGKIVICLGEAR